MLASVRTYLIFKKLFHLTSVGIATPPEAMYASTGFNISAATKLVLAAHNNSESCLTYQIIRKKNQLSKNGSSSILMARPSFKLLEHYFPHILNSIVSQNNDKLVQKSSNSISKI